MSDGEGCAYWVGVALIVAIALSTLSGWFYQDGNSAAEAVRNAGYTNVVVTEKVGWFAGIRGCDEKDQVGWRVRATNAQGQQVTILVCEGIFKSPTLRF